MSKQTVKKGDIVCALTGEEASSKKTGKVLLVFPEKNTAIVEGFNYAKKAMKKTNDNPDGGIVRIEMPMHISNLKRAEKEEG